MSTSFNQEFSRRNVCISIVEEKIWVTVSIEDDSSTQVHYSYEASKYFRQSRREW